MDPNNSPYNINNNNNAPTSDQFVTNGSGMEFQPHHSHEPVRKLNHSYCSQRRTPYNPIRTVEEGVRMIEVILQKCILCGHDIEGINHAYQAIDLLERHIEQVSEYSSQNALQKIIDKVKNIALAKKITSADLISLYHLQNFSDKELSIDDGFKSTLSKFEKTTKSIEEVATHLPCCTSEVLFDEDVKSLIGPIQSQEVAKILDRKKETLQIHETIQKELAIRKSALMQDRTTDPQNYPFYFDELLDNGYLDLYDHLVHMRALSNRIERRSVIEKMTFSQLSHVVLETKEAVIQKVENSISAGPKKVVFLLGGTGSGKSTALCFLRGDKMVLKDFQYESQSEKSGLLDMGEPPLAPFYPPLKKSMI